MMNQIYISYFKTPVGELIIGDFKDQICLCDWRYRKQREQIDIRIKKGLEAEFQYKKTKLIQQTTSELNEYFAEKRAVFSLPLKLIGTKFQIEVWNSLMEIPFGKTISYLDLSKKLSNEKAIRAVANANGANAISILIPCHRIIGSKGELTGYAGGLLAKKKLLILEHSLNNSQLSLF
jgi:methylated-DNA-[protein]-cysteine S-methyltransferase